ncbi:MAG TPA: HIT family protein [Chiayiivirga sp.]|nr:HIT family protein [Chiayiivirga sp.]
MDRDFVLHPQLLADTAMVCNLRLSRVLLMDDANWPWLILVPIRQALRELIDLDREERIVLGDEIDLASRILRARFNPDKLNVAALGNQVEQLHVHVIARHRSDPAWPAPVWGRLPRRHYEPAARQGLLDALAVAFATAV